MRLASNPNTRATPVTPSATRGHVQIPSGPDVVSTDPYVVKMPVVIEMNEKPIANEANLCSVRDISCLYP